MHRLLLTAGLLCLCFVLPGTTAPTPSRAIYNLEANQGLTGGGTGPNVTVGLAPGGVTNSRIADDTIELAKLTPAARTGIVGPAGPQGAAGERGPAGPQGPQGPAGSAPTSTLFESTFNDPFGWIPGIGAPVFHPIQVALNADRIVRSDLTLLSGGTAGPDTRFELTLLMDSLPVARFTGQAQHNFPRSYSFHRTMSVPAGSHVFQMHGYAYLGFVRVDGNSPQTWWTIEVQ